MDYRKIVSLWALLALMLGQVALAHHSATHIDHDNSIELLSSYNHDHSHDHNDSDESDKHQCPECVLTKSLQVAFYISSTALLLPLKAEALAPSQQSLVIATNRYTAHSPRAPPVVLI